MRRVKGCLLVGVVAGVFVVLGGGGFGGGMAESAKYTAVVVLLNPSGEVAQVTVDYIAASGVESRETTSVPAQSRSTLSMDGMLPSPWGAAAIVSSDKPIVAVAKTYWTDSDGCPTTAAGATSLSAPSSTWYFAEGATAGGTEMWLGVLNPNDRSANVNVSYLTFDGVRAGPQFTLSPMESRTVNAADTIPGSFRGSAIVQADVPVYAVRTMAWNDGKSIQQDAGAPALSRSWYFAEGSTAAGFSASIVIQNPNPRPAEISIVYTVGGRSQRAPTFIVRPQGVTDVNVATALPDQVSFSAVVESDPAVVAEQSTMWSGDQGFDTASGAPAASSTWHFPDTGGQMGFESWLAVHNPGGVTAQVDFAFVTDEGPVSGPSVNVPPFGQYSVTPSDYVNTGTSTSAIVTSSVPIVAMQGTYASCGDDLYRDTQLGVTDLDTYWYLPLVPFEPEMQP